jgi:hypothetical protein
MISFSTGKLRKKHLDLNQIPSFKPIRSLFSFSTAQTEKNLQGLRMTSRLAGLVFAIQKGSLNHN